MKENNILNFLEEITNDTFQKADQLSDFVKKNVLNYIIENGYKNFDISLPINFDLICLSVLTKDFPYGLKLISEKKPNSIFYKFYYGNELIDSFEQPYIVTNNKNELELSNKDLKQLLKGITLI